MSEAEFSFRCPHCKREIKKVGIREEEATKPKIVRCSHCGREFDLQQALKVAGERMVEKVGEDLSREFDKLNRGS